MSERKTQIKPKSKIKDNKNNEEKFKTVIIKKGNNKLLNKESKNYTTDDILLISNAIYKNEKDIDNLIKSQKNKNIGYLIKFEEFDVLKQQIHYNKIKSSIKIKFPNSDESLIRNEIEKFCKKRDIVYINQKIFSSSEEFINSLKNEKSFVLITRELWEKLCHKENLSEKGIEFSINKEDNSKIIIIFQNEDKIELQLKKDEFDEYIFNKNSLIDEKQESKENNDKKNLINEILKKINSFEMNKENQNGYYIISNEIKEDLKKINKKIKEDQIKDEDIKTMIKKFNNDQKIISKELKKTKEENKITYFDEFILINKETLQKLESLGFNKEKIKKVKCYLIYKNEILIYDKDNKIQQIGNLDNHQIFTTKYLINELIDDSIIEKIKKKEGFENYLNSKEKNIKKKDNYFELKLKKDKKEQKFYEENQKL